MTLRWFRFRYFTIKQIIVILFLFTLLMIILLTNNLHLQSLRCIRYSCARRAPPVSTYQCHSRKASDNHIDISSLSSSSLLKANIHHNQHSNLKLDSKVLLFVETQYSHLGKLLVETLEASRFKFKIEISGKSLPLLTNLDKGKFSIIIFENFEKYLNMNKWNRELLDKYCREYKVGIIGFMPAREEKLTGVSMKDLPLFFDTNVALSDYHLNPISRVLRIARAGEVHTGRLPGEDWTIFYSNHTSYLPIGEAFLNTVSITSKQESLLSQPVTVQSENNEPNDVNGFERTQSREKVTTVIQDLGLHDGIQRVIFGNGFKFWLHKLIMIDAISFLSHGRLSLPLQRYILIDIDDIFVGEAGKRMHAEDVHALLQAQRLFKLLIPGFRFNLGFSGKYFHKGDFLEDEGDDLLIKYSKEFWWFCHMWSHSQPHIYQNITLLEAQMKLNKEFAEQNNIPIDSGYSIAPHHSGVYPVHEPLYEAWKHVWNVKVTSTEEYPHLRPARLRRGFIHRGIMVLPRQTCGLYTHTIFIDKYPGTRNKLENSIRGGELFYLFIFNPINIFMTHMSNYANDRLALYTFETVIKFVQCWTNLSLKTLAPTQLAAKYFQMHPEESDPVWMNPCNDKRHLSIWSTNKTCVQLPKFLVIGPQKTGTTALYTFLILHPAIRSNHASRSTFEEVQFFNGKNYYKGLDWYMSFYPLLSKNETANVHLFEKSANYFDGELVPMRAHALLPDAKIIVILISPIKLAYSWYQHAKRHRDPVAMNYSFYQVITTNEKSPKALRDLRNRCLNPGCYSTHLEKWLNFYLPQQLMIIDGEELKSDPVTVMTRLQRFIKVEPFIDYHQLLRFDKRKGFFCPINVKNETKCLGSSKGSTYAPLDAKSEKFLRAFYMTHNVALSKLLTRLHQTIPTWLEEDLSKS